MNEDSLPLHSKEILDLIKQGEEPQNYKKILKNFEAVKTCLELIDWAEWSNGQARYDFRLTEETYLVRNDTKLQNEYEDEIRRLRGERARSEGPFKPFIPKLRIPEEEIYLIVEDLRWDPYRIIFLSFTLDYLLCWCKIGKEETEFMMRRLRRLELCDNIEYKALNKLRKDYFIEVAKDNLRKVYSYTPIGLFPYNNEANSEQILGCFMALFKLMRQRWKNEFKELFEPRVITTQEINKWRHRLNEYVKSLKFYLIMVENRVKVIRALMWQRRCNKNTCLTPENVSPLKTGYSVLERYWKNYVLNDKWLDSWLTEKGI